MISTKGICQEAGNDSAPVPSASFVIDLDKGTVASSIAIGVLPIGKITENRIYFMPPSQDGFAWQGSVDRFTGFTAVQHSNNREITMLCNPNCKPANALF